jgi:hypothetical protein
MSIGNMSEQMEMTLTGMGFRKVSQVVSFDQLTDVTTTGSIALTKKIPAGSFVIGSKVTVAEGFVGDTTAVLKLGNAGDDNAYSQADTHNVLAAAQNLMKSAIISADVGVVPTATDTEVLAVVTTGADFTSVTAGKMLIEVFYLSTNVELKDGPKTQIDL